MSMTNLMIQQLPPDVSPEAVCLIDTVLEHRKMMNREASSSAVFEYLESRFQDDALDAELERLHLSKMRDMNAALDAYAALRRKYPTTKFADDRIRREHNDVTDTALFVIDSVVRKYKITDRFDIMSAVCDAVRSKYGEGDRLEVHLRRMHLLTTKDILYAIDIYSTLKQLYPDTVFGRERVRESWADAI